jgi:hypothetical protein
MRTKKTVQETQPRSDKAAITGLSYLAMLDTVPITDFLYQRLSSIFGNDNHWQWATEPNPREKASFLKENIFPIEESGQLQFLPLPTTGNYGFAPELKMDVIFVDGHTEKQMLPVIQYQEKTIVFAAHSIQTPLN